MSLPFTIGAPVENKHIPNSFELSITTMFGDADGYDTFTIGPFIQGADDGALTHLLTVMEGAAKAFPNGRSGGGGYEYDIVPGFAYWFGYDDDGDGDVVDAYLSRNELELDWPTDPYGDGDEQSFDSAALFFYDATGVVHTTSWSAKWRYGSPTS